MKSRPLKQFIWLSPSFGDWILESHTSMAKEANVQGFEYLMGACFTARQAVVNADDMEALLDNGGEAFQDEAQKVGQTLALLREAQDSLNDAKNDVSAILKIITGSE